DQPLSKQLNIVSQIILVRKKIKAKPPEDGKMKEDRLKSRRKDNIREAKSAREFSEKETLKMGFDMINFAMELNRRAKIEED
ncbi:MAG: hypothetical protein V5A88_09070, partial [Candidatus Thermoplasmatota archaeon]